MEWVLFATAFMIFFVVPPCIIYDMIKNPQQFGPLGPRSCDMEGYSSSPLDDAIKPYALFVLLVPYKLYKAIEWVLHAEFMTKDRWFESK